jgi:hypothetical protein
VVDVPARTGDEPIVERNHRVADLAVNERGESALTIASFAPRRLDVTVGHCLRHNCCVVAIPSANVLDALLLSPLTLGGRRRTRRPRDHDESSGAQARHVACFPPRSQ